MSEVCNLLSEIPTFPAGGSSGCCTPIKGHRVSDLFMSFLHCVTLAIDVISRRGIPSNLNIVHEWIPKTYSLQSILSWYVEFFAESDIYTFTLLFTFILRFCFKRDSYQCCTCILTCVSDQMEDIFSHDSLIQSV